MSLCPSCGGVLGRDCYNPQDCAQITHEQEMTRRQFADPLAWNGEVFFEQDRRLVEACGTDKPSGSHRDLVDEVCGLLRVTRGQRDDAERLYLSLRARLNDAIRVIEDMHDASVDAYNFIGGAKPPITRDELIVLLRDCNSGARRFLELNAPAAKAATIVHPDGTKEEA